MKTREIVQFSGGGGEETTSPESSGGQIENMSCATLGNRRKIRK